MMPGCMDRFVWCCLDFGGFCLIYVELCNCSKIKELKGGRLDEGNVTKQVLQVSNGCTADISDDIWRSRHQRL